MPVPKKRIVKVLIMKRVRGRGKSMLSNKKWMKLFLIVKGERGEMTEAVEKGKKV